MRPINIFQFTRVSSTKALGRFEKIMSGRENMLPVRDWEVNGLRLLSDKMYQTENSTSGMCFFYSFQIPKLGKEFDLLRISDEVVVNIELKSGNVSDDEIKRQLQLNRHYLTALGKTVRSYTYVSNDDRLLRLTNSGYLIETEYSQLCEDLCAQKNCYEDDIEDLFKEEEYLISPLTDPDRFLRGDYFLTSQQKDIRKQILKKIASDPISVQGFTGLPGTGKTLLLYDLAMTLSESDRVVVLHYGSYPKELLLLDERLHRIDFVLCGTTEGPTNEAEYSRCMDGYNAVLIDEAHRMKRSDYTAVLNAAALHNIPVIASYDCEDSICPEERPGSIDQWLDEQDKHIEYRLTNRIRTNSELSSYVQCLMFYRPFSHRKEFESVSVAYANDYEEAAVIIEDFKKQNYVFIYDRNLEGTDRNLKACTEDIFSIDSETATCREFSKVLMVCDSNFFYDDKGYLRSSVSGSVRKLFHGLSRAKHKLCLVIVNNPELFELLLKVGTQDLLH